MNKKTGIVIGVVILLLVVLGIVVFSMKNKNKTQTTSTMMTQPETQNSTTETTQGTLKSLFTSGKSVQCSYNNATADNSANVSGTVSVASGKMRGDFKTTTNETTVNTHMIVDSQNSYIWTDMSKQGFKFAITDQQQTSTAGKTQGPDMNQVANYSCQPWKADDSVFTLPSDITFSTFTMPTTAPNAAGGTQTGVSGQCSVCDNIPAGSGRDTCKAQLNCP